MTSRTKSKLRGFLCIIGAPMLVSIWAPRAAHADQGFECQPASNLRHSICMATCTANIPGGADLADRLRRVPAIEFPGYGGRYIEPMLHSGWNYQLRP